MKIKKTAKERAEWREYMRDYYRRQREADGYARRAQACRACGKSGHNSRSPDCPAKAKTARKGRAA